MVTDDDDDDDFDVPACAARLPLPEPAPWMPVAFLQWMNKVSEKWPTSEWNFYVRMLSDHRMRPVWQWLDELHQHPVHEPEETPKTLDPLSFAMSAYRATKLPSKPGDLSPRARDAYLEKVRTHTRALMNLLEDTPYSSNSASWTGEHGDYIDDEDLARSVLADLSSWGIDESDEGHIVAYRVTRNGVMRLPWTFPESHLYEMLCDLFDWTNWDDHWSNLTVSSAPISQANSPSTRTIFFNCTLFDTLKWRGISIPFVHMATTCNVSLQLPIEAQVDEESVRKQVRRYQKRQAEKLAARVIPF